MARAGGTSVLGRGGGGLFLVVLLMLKICLVKPLVAAAADRLAEFAEVLQDDLVVVIGSGARADVGRPFPNNILNVTTVGMVWGRQRGGLANKYHIFVSKAAVSLVKFVQVGLRAARTLHLIPACEVRDHARQASLATGLRHSRQDANVGSRVAPVLSQGRQGGWHQPT